MKSPFRGANAWIGVAALLVLLSCVHAAKAQAPPLSHGSMGTFSLYQGTGQCPSTFLTSMTCYTVPITCPSTDSMTLLFGYALAQNSKGLIVFFNGDGGTSPLSHYTKTDEDYAQDYLNAGYSVVLAQWMSDWELTTNPTNPDQAFNIQVAACRPATFLWWARNNGTGNIQTQGPVIFPVSNSQAGMCAQGFSAGAAAISYALAWYNAGAAASGGPTGGAGLDKAVMNAGPVLSEIEPGCTDTPGSNTTNICNGQSYCSGWPQGGVWQGDAFVQGTEGWVRKWAGDHTCQTGGVYSLIPELNWEAQSIITGPGNPQPNLSYPATQISSYLCYSYHSQTDQPNGSSPQGWFFFQGAANSGTFPYKLLVNGVQTCDGPEGVSGSDAQAWNGTIWDTASNVVEKDMLSGLSLPGKNGTLQCTKSPGY